MIREIFTSLTAIAIYNRMIETGRHGGTAAVIAVMAGIIMSTAIGMALVSMSKGDSKNDGNNM